MSLLQQYAQLEQQAKELQKQMEILQERSDFKKEKEFLEKLQGLIEEFGRTPQDVINQLSPKSLNSTATERTMSVVAPTKLNTPRVARHHSTNQEHLDAPPIPP